MTNIVKLQRRSDVTFVTIPTELAKKFEQFSHMKATINGQGNLEFKSAW